LTTLLPAELRQSVERYLNYVKRGTLNQWLVGLRWLDRQPVLDTLSLNAIDFKTRPFGLYPGVDGLHASLYLREGVGRAILGRQELLLSSEKLTVKPMPPVTLQGTLRFAVGVNGFSLESQNLQAETVDVATTSSLSIRQTRDGKVPFTLNTAFLGGDLASLDRYYLKPFIRPPVRKWLEEAIISGKLVNGDLLLSGNARAFAPYRGRGSLTANLAVRDAEIQYRPDWPALRQVDASVKIVNSGIDATIYSAQTREATIDDARVQIKNTLKPVVEVQATGQGSVPDLLDFVQNGPLATSIGTYFGDASGKGDAQLALDLAIPLADNLASRWKTDGVVALDNASVNAREYGIKAENVSGSFNFSQRGIEASGASLRYLGLPLTLNAELTEREDGWVNTTVIKGPVSIASVLNSYEIELPEVFRGVSPMTAELAVLKTSTDDARVTFKASSDLRGTEITLPEPFAKPAGKPTTALISTDFTAPERDWVIRVPGQLDSRIRLNDKQELQSMAFALGGSTNTVMPWYGMAINGR